MADPVHALVLRPRELPAISAALQEEQERLRLRAQAAAIEVGVDVAGLLVSAGRAAVEVERGRCLSALEDRASARRIEEIAAQTEQAIAPIHARTSSKKETTEQIRLLTNALADPRLGPEERAALLDALAHLAREP